jgi:hypothetical protein
VAAAYRSLIEEVMPEQTTELDALVSIHSETVQGVRASACSRSDP